MRTLDLPKNGRLPPITKSIVSAGGKGSHYGRFKPEPVVHPGRAPVGGDAVRTLQQILNSFADRTYRVVREASSECLCTRLFWESAKKSSPAHVVGKCRTASCSSNRSLLRDSWVTAVKASHPLPRIDAQDKVPACAREGRFTRRMNCYLLSQSVETNIGATGIPRHGLGGTTREGHV